MYIHILMRTRRQANPKSLHKDARDVVTRCPGLKIRQVARRITRLLDATLADQGLTLAQFALMAQIAAAEDDTINGLAARTDLDQSTLSRNLRALERAGLIEIAVVEKDLRRRAVWLTERGARQLERAMPSWRRALATITREVDIEAILRLADATGTLESDSPARARR